MQDAQTDNPPGMPTDSLRWGQALPRAQSRNSLGQSPAGSSRAADEGLQHPSVAPCPGLRGGGLPVGQSALLRHQNFKTYEKR